MARVIIFGQRDYAEQAHYYLTHDSPHEVVAFSVTADQCQAKTFRGLPLVPFEEIEERYPADDHRFFAPMSGRSMNRMRERFYQAVKAKGYDLISYVSSRAILNGNEIGENCFILETTDIQPFVRIGNNVIIWCKTHVGHHSVIDDHTWIGSGVVISGRCQIDKYSYLASQTVVDAGVRLAEGTLAGLGAIVKRDTEPWGIYLGVPARRRKVSSKDYEFL